MKKIFPALLPLFFFWIGCVGTDITHEETLTDPGASVVVPTATPEPEGPAPTPTSPPSVCAAVKVTASQITSAEIRLNSVVLFDENEFHGEALLQITKSALLFEGENTLKLRLRGDSGMLRVEVLNCAAPPNPLFNKTYERLAGSPAQNFTDTFDSTYNPD